MTIVLVLLASGGILAARRGGSAQDWAGTWDTRWPDGSARIVLRQRGAQVDGTYRLYDGRLTGTVTGDTLQGTWSEGPRHGRFVFVRGPFGQGFSGRFDGDAWWTGMRADPRRAPAVILDDTPQHALRSFLIAANRAAAGDPDSMADARGLVDFGPDAAAADARQRLARTRALFAALDMTTFRTSALPDPPPRTGLVTYTLHQAGTDATLALTLRRQPDGHWRLAAPDEAALAAAIRMLDQRDADRPAGQEGLRDDPRATMRRFVDAMLHWDGADSQAVLDTMDLSQIRAAYRAEQGMVQAQYMIQMINRVGAWQWQAIPDDPASRQPYVFFTHPAGRIVIAPQGSGAARRWRFTAGTVASQLRLYIATRGMPADPGIPAMAPPAGLFAFRAHLAAISPLLLRTGIVPGLENWQIAAVMIALIVSALILLVAVPLLIRLFAVVAGLLGQDLDAAIQRRLVWPLRLMAIALIWYKLSRRLGLAGPGLPVIDSIMGVVAAIGVAWAGLPIVDVVAGGVRGQISRPQGTMDDILVSLTAGLFKLALMVTVAVAAAEALDLPVEGMITGLGIGGLAVAFASKETLSNLFGAGILLADQPFRKGDTIAMGDMQGTVEDVGIRSTRIRTMDDTVIIVPNGKLTDAMINNFGARRYRLFRTRFTVGYGATPEQLGRFTQKLRELVDGQPAVAEERTQVGLSELSSDGIGIDLLCYFRARDAAEERAARHDLLLQVMMLAKQEGVGLTGAASAVA